MKDSLEELEETIENIRETVKDTQIKAQQQAQKIVKTAMVYHYFIGFALRLAVFLLVFTLYIFKKALFVDLLSRALFMVGGIKVTILRILWVVFMAIMISHLIPMKKKSMALLKLRESRYEEDEGYSRLRLLESVQEMNQRAWIVMLAWLSFNAIFGILYLAGVLHQEDLFMLTVFYFLSDYICIIFFCPFQTKIMKNKCCVNCRIYDWGHFMMFTPMIFIKSFFSWSLFFTAIVVLIHWEFTYAQHPERFSEISNKKLRCANCNDKTCQVKKKLQAKHP